MRRFHSYGPIDKDEHYYVPRKELIESAYTQLIGHNPQKGGHYITVWSPRQCGKTWVMQEVMEKIKGANPYEVGIITMEPAKEIKSEKKVLKILIEKLQIAFNRSFPAIESIDELSILFTSRYFQNPAILILDEFDALEEVFINRFAGIFRDMFINRTNEREKTSREKNCLLHGLALVGVRSVLGIENKSGSPFNVQRSVHIPNLAYDEVKEMFQWYRKESGQEVEEAVVRELFEETRGQPGLTCWFGELLTETYNHDKNNPINMINFKEAYGAATHILPNNNILNLISKVNQPPYDEMIMEFFKTGDKIEFKLNNKVINYLYMNGVIAEEKVDINEYYVKFSCPFVQKCLFDFFSNRVFSHLGLLIHPLDAMEDAIDEQRLNIPNIIKRYKAYLQKNRQMLFKDAPRRKTDLKIYEAVYHFNLYRYVYDLLKHRKVEVVPQFPTGNGKIDLILKYRERVYALELKSFKDMYTHGKAVRQAAEYGRQLGLKEIVLLVFVELTEEEAGELAREVEEAGVKVIVIPVGIL